MLSRATTRHCAPVIFLLPSRRVHIDGQIAEPILELLVVLLFGLADLLQQNLTTNPNATFADAAVVVEFC